LVGLSYGERAVQLYEEYAVEIEDLPGWASKARPDETWMNNVLRNYG
jgi:hypothetical protein